MMGRATTIQEVLDRLDTIIDKCIATNSRLGLFAYIYHRTTAEIQREIMAGSFEDNPRMERMDVAFANLYLDAFHNYRDGAPTSKSWAFAFSTKDEPLTILQHILLGINTHINLDLAIATSASMMGKELTDIEKDFTRVNDILFNITNEMQERLGRVSPLMFLLDFAGQNTDEKIIDFSMRKAREQSWNGANLLWAIGSDQHTEAINGIDALVLKIAKRIKSPKSKIIGFALRNIAKWEEKNVAKIISRLREDR